MLLPNDHTTDLSSLPFRSNPMSSQGISVIKLKSSDQNASMRFPVQNVSTDGTFAAPRIPYTYILTYNTITLPGVSS